MITSFILLNASSCCKSPNKQTLSRADAGGIYDGMLGEFLSLGGLMSCVDDKQSLLTVC